MASQQPTQPQSDPALIWYDCYCSISNAADTKEYATTELLCNDMDEDAHWHGHHLKVFTTIMAEKMASYATAAVGEEQVIADSMFGDKSVPAYPMGGETKKPAVPDDEVECACSTVTEFEDESQLDGVFEDENAHSHDFGAAYERQSQRNPGSAEWERRCGKFERRVGDGVVLVIEGWDLPSVYEHAERCSIGWWIRFIQS